MSFQKLGYLFEIWPPQRSGPLALWIRQWQLCGSAHGQSAAGRFSRPCRLSPGPGRACWRGSAASVQEADAGAARPAAHEIEPSWTLERCQLNVHTELRPSSRRVRCRKRQSSGRSTHHAVWSFAQLCRLQDSGDRARQRCHPQKPPAHHGDLSNASPQELKTSKYLLCP